MTIESCLTVEKVIKALKTLDDEIQLESNKMSTIVQYGQAEKQQFNMLVGSKSLTINMDKDVLKTKFKEEFYYDN